MQVRDKVNSCEPCFSNDMWFLSVEKCRFSTAVGASYLARWEMKSCTLLWQEARFEVFEVKMYKTHHAPCSKFRTLLQVATSKKCRLLRREAHVQAKSTKH